MGVEVMTKEDGLNFQKMIDELRAKVEKLEKAQGGLTTDLTMQQLAKKLNRSTQFITERCKLYKKNPKAREALKYYKAGKQYRFRPQDVEDWKVRTEFNHQAA